MFKLLQLHKCKDKAFIAAPWHVLQNLYYDNAIIDDIIFGCQIKQDGLSERWIES